MDDMHESESKINDVLKRSGSCRVHSLQNISRKRDMDALCDHLVMRLPPETNYQVAKPVRLVELHKKLNLNDVGRSK